MKYVIVAIRDSAVGAFGRPVFTASTGVAIRSFSDEVNSNRDGNDLNRHPQDFELYHLGEFDDERAAFLLIEPKMLCRGQDVQTNKGG